MSWFKLYQSRQRHPKTIRLATLLKEDRRYICGLLDDLWAWALDIAKRDGRLEGLTADDIAGVLDYPRKKGPWLLGALVNSGYMDIDADGVYRLHDWDDYAGQLNDRRERDAERKRTVRRTSAGQSAGRPQDVRYPEKTREEKIRKEKNVVVDSAPDTGDWNPFGATPETPPETIEAYLSANLAVISPGIIDELRGYQDAGMQDDAIRYAVDQAAAQGKRNWAYVKGILRRWEQAGIFTAGAARAADDQRSRKEQTRATDHRPSHTLDAGRRESPSGSSGDRYKPEPAEIERIARERGILPPLP